ncbi:MsnO8 family LLM class oxidoreductase [Plantactinospora endophytica]|uniref:Monooxygenase (Luciferase-like) n=1 Tax=Plantactinospora endophytica TaxID=673535 RepID=A0ABQ4E160_9ACTN|nr:MsnO8 family LLM class oxidoreductase [Plantactinospora endophytica]GIG88445.1 putative monooxygenase (luciferase-like) [Plantactinospora endophytica]
MSPTPLSVLDLSPVPSGGTVGDALRNTVDLARRAEQFGYRRYWLAEHHFAAGVASAAPAVLIGQVAAATSALRVGSGAVQLGHQTALAVVEQFGTLDALFPGRIDLGLGRSGQRRVEAVRELAAGGPEPAHRAGPQVVDGLLIPAPFSFAKLLTSPRFALYSALLQQPGAESPDFADQVGDILALLRGEYRDESGLDAHAVPGEGADLQVWLLGSSGGQSAQLAGALGLPFAANYHVSPATVLEAVRAYRAAFRPSAALAEPYVVVSADVVVAAKNETARELAAPYGLWVRGIRTGQGAIPFPSPEQAAGYEWSAEERELVADRVATQFVGAPATVAAKLRVLRDVTGADELLVTTITHEHAARVDSYALLAKEWFG